MLLLDYYYIYQHCMKFGGSPCNSLSSLGILFNALGVGGNIWSEEKLIDLEIQDNRGNVFFKVVIFGLDIPASCTTLIYIVRGKELSDSGPGDSIARARNWRVLIPRKRLWTENRPCCPLFCSFPLHTKM